MPSFSSRASGLLLLTLPALFHQAEALTLPKTQAGVETCLQAALEKLRGEAVKLELKTEQGKPTYEIEIAGQDRTMEFECDANTGKITEEEQEVASPEHPLFKSKAKISLQQAQAIALKAQSGKIIETEFEIESDGAASYEFDIQKPDGSEVKLEIDAASGVLREDQQQELYQIGRE